MSRKRDPEKKFYTSDEMLELLSQPDPWHRKVYFWLRDIYEFYRYGPSRIRQRWLRSKEGFAPADAWDFDNHMARVIVAGVAEIRKFHREVVGKHPPEIEFEEWEEILEKIEDGYRGYLTMKDDWSYWESPKFKEAQTLFNKWFAGMWI